MRRTENSLTLQYSSCSVARRSDHQSSVGAIESTVRSVISHDSSRFKPMALFVLTMPAAYFFALNVCGYRLMSSFS
jgi:hypothetical protein